MNRRLIDFAMIIALAVFSNISANEAMAGWGHRCRRQNYSSSNYTTSNAQAMTPEQMQQEFQRQESVLTDVLTDQISRVLGGGGGGVSGNSNGITQRLDAIDAELQDIKGRVVNNASILQAIGQEVVTVHHRVVTIQEHLKIKTDESSNETGSASDAKKKVAKKKKPAKPATAKPPKPDPIQELTAKIEEQITKANNFQTQTAADIDFIKKELDKKQNK